MADSWILGLSRGHNATTCLLKNGEIVFSIEEERLSRTKYDGGPLMGILETLKYTDKLDYVVIVHTQPLSMAGNCEYTGDPIYESYLRKLGLIERMSDMEGENIEILVIRK